MIIEQETVSLPRSSPEAQGIASSALLALVDDLEKNIHEIHSLMLMRHGHVVAEGWWTPYGPEHPHMLFSLSKSFTSTAAGLAVAEGHFSLDDLVLSFFPDEAPAQPDANLAAMRIRHLLSMATGHAQNTSDHFRTQPEGNWVKAFLQQPVEYTPGTHFIYNNGATYMVSAIVQKTTGKTLMEYLKPRLFEPLGIEGATWETCPRGINTGAWGLSVKTKDIAYFGQLYLQKGMWQGKRLLPEGWVEEASASHVSNGDNPESDWNQGYGFQFWRCRHGAYRGDGAFGQYCVVLPEQDMVLAITGGLGDMQPPLDIVWKHLLPAIQTTALPEDSSAETELRHRLENLALRTPQGQPTSPLATRVSGKTYRFDPNEQKIETVRFDFGPETCLLTLQDALGEHHIPCGYGDAWPRGVMTTDLGPRPLVASQPIAANGAWASEDTFVLKFCFYETPFCPILTFQFKDSQVLLDYRENVAFGPLEHPQLVGQTQ